VSGGIGETGFSTNRGDIPRDLLIKNRNIVEKILIIMLSIEKKLRKNSEFSEAYFLPFAAAVKKKVNVPVISVGGIRLRKTMENILKNKDADFIALSRPFIRQPNLVNQFEKGEKDPITCNNCNRCSFEMIVHHKPMRCYNKDIP
jgi:2,4-dienoyl-CoA reductase-like NADH-dependent reductase (Old Yellow Enzyme family)